MTEPGKPRITVSIADNGEVEIHLNEAGRDLLVKELTGLSERNDHFHLGPFDPADIEVSTRPYRPTDTIVEWSKVLFRPDDWDREYYPHVMDD